MRIGKKLNLLIAGIIVAMVVVVGVFAVIYIPTVKMSEEKNSLYSLDSAILGLRADINSIPFSAFDSAVEKVQDSHDNFVQQFKMLDNFTTLNKDSEIAEALEIIKGLYSLGEENYGSLLSITEEVRVFMQDILFSSQLVMFDVVSDPFFLRSDSSDAAQVKFEDLNSFIWTVNMNLSSNHSVVEEQFMVINEVIDRKEKNAFLIGIITIVLMAVGALFSAIRFAAMIVRNLYSAGAGIKRMSSGDISSEFNINSKDEIGELAVDLNTLTSSLKEAFNLMKRGSSEGVTLKKQLIIAANDTLVAARQIAETSQGIESQFKVLSDSVEGASSANIVMKDSLVLLEDFVQDQTAMVEESTSAVTEMISSINNVAEIAAKKQEATNVLVKTAESGGAKLDATTSEINKITANLDEIKGTASIIQQIASQTNLLAMNAAIEAAHAGDAGRGFAVVADEIRKLAEASSMNSKQISGVLKEVVTRIESASISSKETQTAFQEIDSEIHSVSQSLNEISASMDELNVGGKQILEAMAGLQEVSIKVNQGSSEMKESSEKVSESIETVENITAEVSGSASEINIGITEVSASMSIVTELSDELGKITDELESQAGKFTTEVEVLAELEPEAEGDRE